MKPLPKIDDLRKHYETEFNSTGHLYSHPFTLTELLKEIEKEDNPVIFKEILLAITQLFVDGVLSISQEENIGAKVKTALHEICHRVRNDEEWSEQKEILDKLCQAGKYSIGTFYRGEGIDCDGVREIVLPNRSEIIKYGKRGKAEPRRLALFYDCVKSFGLKIPEILDEEAFDTLVCNASGGFEPSFLAMDILEKEHLTIVRYSRFRWDFRVKVPKNAPKEDYLVSNIKGKKVLVIDDAISTGKTLRRIMRYISRIEPDELYAAVVRLDGYILPKLSGTELINREKPLIYRSTR